MRNRDGTRRRRRRMRSAPGFTLIEMIVVMVIVGIILSLILTAAWGGVRRAEERATQALISKLETGITDRIEALLSTRVDPTQGHQLLASIYNASIPVPITSQQRAQVIANIDHLKAELPDVFYVTATSGTDPDASPNYPINFCAAGFGSNYKSAQSDAPYTLPYDLPTIPVAARSQVTGFYGASVTARAALYKNVNPGGNSPLLPTGYDMIDNTGEGLIDEIAEGVGTNNANVWNLFRNQHQHKTARAEVLYAILVEGQGPLGSVFNADDFTDREVQDTDGDGLPEFVDAWSQPLQFFRWPLFFHSDIQRGYVIGQPGPYLGVFEPREQNPLDPNQMLMAPAWWTSFNANPAASAVRPYSGAVTSFQSLFHSLVEPNGVTAANLSPLYDWDRSGAARRAFYSKFLIASSGLDQEPGVVRLDVYQGKTQPTILVPLLMLESQARQTDLSGDSAYFFPSTPGWVNPATGNTPLDAGVDDITNHNYQAPGGVVEQ